MVYLASPYSHPDAAVRLRRFKDACKKAAQYAMRGECVFSPIAHSHAIAAFLPEEYRTDFNLWMKMDLPILTHADEMHILCIEGWKESKGIAREISHADRLGIPVKQVYMDD